MGMHTLPLLDKDHGLFDWEDFPSSYNALKPGTPTKEFDSFTWRWMVFVLMSALNSAGLEWDDKYTDYSNAMIHEEDKRLTARKFNSVAWNVDRLFPVVWEWAENPEHRGYVGRLEFHGRSEYGRECDKVYPEYILELVEKINFLIELMRGTWPTCQSGGTALAPVRIKAAGASNRALVSPINLLAQVPLYGVGIAAKGVAMNGQMLTGVEVQTGAQALLCLPSGADSRSYSSHNIRGNILPGALSEAGCQVFSTERAKADKHRSVIGAAQSAPVLKSQAEAESNLLALAGAKYLVPLRRESDVDGCPAGHVDGTYLADVLKRAQMQAFAALAGTGYHRAKGVYRVKPEKHPGARMDAIFHSRSARKAKAEKVMNSTTGAQYTAAMLTDAELNAKPARYGSGRYKATLISGAEAEKNMAAAAAAAAAFESISWAEAKKNLHAAAVGEYAAESTGWVIPEIRPNMEVRGSYLADMQLALAADANPTRDVTALETARSDSYGGAESLPPLDVRAKKTASTKTQAGAETDPILMAEALHTGQTVQNGGAESVLALFVSATQASAVRDWAGLEALEALQVASPVRSGIRKLAQPVSNTSAQVTAKQRSGSSVRCALELLAPEATWYDPVQNGSDLYIRSVWSSYQDLDKLFVDVGEWYEPIREDSNLHIRSAYSSWTDGGKLNIDTAFFLEPVQEGSNLHIRMDIFGGE